MKVLFIEYPKCSTCQKAKKWLIENKIDFEDRDIVKNNPNSEEIKEYWKKSGEPLKKFFNTSGVLYREMNLKEKVAKNKEEELLEILGSNGMLIKRPLIIGENGVLIGFKEDNWKIFFNK
ncbi:MAG: arsenate reductase family protein [Cetobacterium sp.]|nr:arsenate reductase family protein [Cetobacterium sp.]